MGTQEQHEAAHGKYTQPWDVEHAERHLMAKVQENLIDTVNATAEPGEVIIPPAASAPYGAEKGPGRLFTGNLTRGRVVGKFHKQANKRLFGRFCYAYAEGTRKPISLGLGFSLGPRNSVVVVTLPLVELCVGFSENDEYERR